MDKVMKAEIEKILKELYERGFVLGKTTELTLFENARLNIKANNDATSSLTALIIKWLEGKKAPHIVILSNKDFRLTECRTIEDWQKVGRNQLITELVEELK
jgi:hypothetical protein